jgi:hypothetical protein
MPNRKLHITELPPAYPHAHTALMSNVGQRFLDFYIAAKEQ